MYDLELWKKAKKEQKLTLEDIAKKSNIGISTIKDIFRGVTYAPRLDTVEAIEKALGLNKPNADDNAPLLTDKEKALLEAFNNMLPETQDFVLRTVQSLQDKKSVT